MHTVKTEWKRPPVIEVVVGMQFDALESLTNGHLGWFWGEMHAEFPKSDDVPPIPHAVEMFGEDTMYGFPALGFRQATGDSRLRMTSADGNRMIQVQNGWLIANWTKKTGHDYPGFSDVKGLFDKAKTKFEGFLSSRNLGTLRPNLWEVTYIDHIDQGTVWKDLRDLPDLFPGFYGRAVCQSGACEAVDSTWAWRLGPTPGRLRVTIQSARVGMQPAKDILQVRSVARGPIGPESGHLLDECLNFGRLSVVDTFMANVSKEAIRYWEGEGT